MQRIQASAAIDPTAMAIAASAAGILFASSVVDQQRPSASISSNDTAAGLWRNQTIAYGLETFLNDRFAQWADENTDVPGHFRDTWQRLRTATLLSGFAGDHPSWRAEYAQLAQYTLQACPTGQLSTEACAGLLTDLRLAGDDDSVKRCARKLLRAGPLDAVRRACASVNLRESTHSTGLSDLELVGSAAEVIEEDQADKYVREAVQILEDERRYAKRVRPTFLIHNYVLQTLESLMRDSAVSTAGRRVLIDFFLALPAIIDQSFAHSLARVLRAVPEGDWAPQDLDQLRLRNDDNWELKETLVGITAVGTTRLGKSYWTRFGRATDGCSETSQRSGAFRKTRQRHRSPSYPHRCVVRPRKPARERSIETTVETLQCLTFGTPISLTGHRSTNYLTNFG